MSPAFRKAWSRLKATRGQVPRVLQQGEEGEEDSHGGQHDGDHPGHRPVDAVYQGALDGEGQEAQRRAQGFLEAHQKLGQQC